MRPLLSLIRREFAAYFLSPIAYVTLAVFLLVTALPVLEMVARRVLGLGIPGEATIVQHFTFWAAFLGAKGERLIDQLRGCPRRCHTRRDSPPDVPTHRCRTRKRRRLRSSAALWGRIRCAR